jgi:pimeloyl-ACP methyl ester carboxylesterase
LANGGKAFSITGKIKFFIVSTNRQGSDDLLHGFPSSSFDYHKIWNALNAEFSVLAFDLIGYGFSDKPSSFDYTTFNQTDILCNLVEQSAYRKTAHSCTRLRQHDHAGTSRARRRKAFEFLH